MCTDMCTDICADMCADVCGNCVGDCVWTRVWTCVRTSAQACSRLYTQRAAAHMSKYFSMHMSKHVPVHMSIHMSIHMHVYTHFYKHIYTHVYKHVHARAPAEHFGASLTVQRAQHGMACPRQRVLKHGLIIKQDLAPDHCPFLSPVHLHTSDLLGAVRGGPDPFHSPKNILKTQLAVLHQNASWVSQRPPIIGLRCIEGDHCSGHDARMLRRASAAGAKKRRCDEPRLR